jgi:hypothetical protein
VPVTAQQKSTVLVDIEIIAPDGERVYQRTYDRRSFSKGQTRTFSFTWTAPVGSPTGIYAIKVGIFETGWGSLLSWNDNAGTIVMP